MRLGSGPLLFLIFVLFAPSAFAQRFQGPVATALGGTGRATMDPLESFFLNPASLGFLPPYLNLGGHYQSGERPGEGESRALGAVLSDGTPDKFIPGAFSYIRDTRKTPTGAESTDDEYRGSVGQIVYAGVSAGASLHYREHKLKGGPRYFQTNIDAGAIWAPIEMLSIGLVAQNILSADDKAPVSVRDVPTFGFGFHASYERMFNFRLDLSRPDKFNPRERTDIGMGFESSFENGLSLRAGCNWKETVDQTLLGAGLGYRGPRLQVDYAFQKDARVDQATRHLVDLWIPF